MNPLRHSQSARVVFDPARTEAPVLRTRGLTKVYGSTRGGVSYPALRGIDLEVRRGEFLGIMGPSGSGKTTLLNLLATIDTPSSGTIEIDGEGTVGLKPDQLAEFRRRRLGFVFQDFNLLDNLSVGENMMLPLVLDEVDPYEMQRRLQDLAVTLGLSELLEKRSYEVSGGQQQRAAIGRAIIHRPSLLLADEPTGNLESKSAFEVMAALQGINQGKGATIVLVTHDAFAASFCERVLFLKDGSLFSELRRHEGPRQVFFQQVMDALSIMGGSFGDVPAAGLP